MDTNTYNGLVWTRPDPGRSRIAAASAITPTSYLIDYSQAEAIGAYAVFADGRAPEIDGTQPHARIGIYKDIELALLACERHDYMFVRAQAEAKGVTCLFIGSERVAHLARMLRAEDEEKDPDQILDLIVPDFICKNGRPFRRMASYFDAKKTAAKQNSDGSFALTFTVPPRDLPVWLIEAPLGTPATLGAVLIAGGTKTEDEKWAERGAHAFTRAHALPNDPHFQEWMAGRYDRWGKIAAVLESGNSEDVVKGKNGNSEEVAKATLETLKRLVGVPRRRDLHTDRDAIERLERIDREYYRDMARGHGIYVRAA